MRIIKTIGLFFLIPLLMKQLTKSGSFLWDDLIGLGCATNDETTNEQTIIQQTRFKQVAYNPLRHLKAYFLIFGTLIKIIS
jgi:hypothetical protein